MQLEDKEIIAIDKKMSILREKNETALKKTKEHIPPTKKEFLLSSSFVFGLFLILCCISGLVFSYVNYNLEHYDLFRSGNSLIIGCFASSAAFVSLAAYPIIQNNDYFRTLKGFFEIMTLFFILIMAVTVFYSMTIGITLVSLKNNFNVDMHILNNFILALFAFCLIYFYVKTTNILFVKNKEEQQAFIDKREKKLLPEIERTEKEYNNLREKIIDSVRNLNDLAYFKHFIKSSNTIEVSLLEDKIEKDILEKNNYNTFNDYEKDMLKERVNNDKNGIINN